MGRPARGEGQVEQKPGHRHSQINFLMVVHGEQKVELHKPLPTSGTFTAQGRTVGAYDKGKDKGAVIVNETRSEEQTSELKSLMRSSYPVYYLKKKKKTKQPTHI